ncbi:MAG: GDSL-type esterase/lipase family protein, partial [Bacteroidales bacterium]|nr:GDSL-type esterase/lipase family protein [Bacteroidales bacterium]
KMKKYFVTLILTFLCLGKLSAQDYPFDITYYPFVNYKGGKLIFSKDSAKFERIFQKTDSLIKFGKGKLNVVQIGASHTQADIFSHRMRVRLQTFHPGLVGARGFVFPYRMTKSNNPSNYIISYSGFWTTCRNVEWKRSCELGISGASATTLDVNARISISMNPNNQVKYDFNEVKIFTAPHLGQFEIVPDIEMGNYTVSKIDSLGYIDIKFEKYQEVAKFHFEKTDESQQNFTLYGFSLENDNPGVTYSGLGINGASFSSWLGCAHFEKQLQMLNPDWFVIFLGVNDANTYRFDEDFYYNNYVTFIERVKRYCPNAVWTFVVPNDFYLFKKRPNPAMEKEEEVVKKLVEKYGESMFSIYDIMGGYGSSLTWVKNGLMAYDKVHMTATGYTFCADMFFNAFLQSYSNYLDAKKRF